ncbi:alpha/beta-hydrolase [Sarocladium strictum]
MGDRYMSRLGWLAVAVAAFPIGLYTVFLGLGSTPFFQRHFLYAHKINTLAWNNLLLPEKWGFARNQVTPFHLETPDGESLFAWHVLPLPLYLQHEARLAGQEPGLAEDVTTTDSFKLLRDDPEARLVLYFHGNAGHVAQAWRPDTYHSLTDTSSYHVVAIDYRGFGLSTGTPDEQGLITDAATVVNWALHVAKVPADRIVLLGQSLGTAVATAVAEKYALQGVDFGGIVLVAGFSDLTTMLSGYKIGGLFPVLAPVTGWPFLLRRLHRAIVDKWSTANRLANIVRHSKGRVRLSLIHAEDDTDIPWTEDNVMFRAVVEEKMGSMDDDEFETWKEERTVRKGDGSFVSTWVTEPDMVVRQELFPYGGHNKIMRNAPVALAIMRCFDLQGTSYES